MIELTVTSDNHFTALSQRTFQPWNRRGILPVKHSPWDAEAMSLAANLAWLVLFDASKHWVGRGPGTQTPARCQVLSLEENSPLRPSFLVRCRLASASAVNETIVFLAIAGSAGVAHVSISLWRNNREDTARPMQDATQGVIIATRIASQRNDLPSRRQALQRKEIELLRCVGGTSRRTLFNPSSTQADCPERRFVPLAGNTLNAFATLD